MLIRIDFYIAMVRLKILDCINHPVVPPAPSGGPLRPVR